MRPRLLVWMVVACAAWSAVTGLSAGAASAASGSQVISDCNSHGSLTKHYPVGQLRAALSTMPADVREYTDCYDVIQRTLLVQLGGSHATGTTSSGSGGSFLPTALIVIVALLVLAAAGFAAVAIRRRPGP